MQFKLLCEGMRFTVTVLIVVMLSICICMVPGVSVSLPRDIEFWAI